MKFVDINKRYTELVAEYIRKGYTINAATMSGSQGEIAKVDLTNGTDIIRIYVGTFTDWNHYYGLEGVEIVIGISTDDVVPNSHSDFGTVWSSRLNILRRERFYKIGDGRKSGRMYGTIEEAEAAIAKRVARHSARECKSNTFTPTSGMMAIAKRVVRDKFVYKRIIESGIKLTKHRGKYTVSYRNESYTLH